MAEEDTTGGIREEVAAGLAADDIKPGVYEGGFKTWECAVDLAGYLLAKVDEGELRGKELCVFEV